MIDARGPLGGKSALSISDARRSAQPRSDGTPAIGPDWDRHFGYRMLARESRDVATANADIGKFAIGEIRKLVHGVVVALPCAEVAGNGCKHGHIQERFVAQSERPRWRFSDAFIAAP